MTKTSLKKRAGPRTLPQLPEVLKIIGEESQRNGTDRLTSRQIDATIKAYRKAKRKERAV